MDKTIDVLIIGAGPIGLACGIEAKKRGLSHHILDKGCLTNSIFQYPLNMTFFSTPEKLEIGDIPFISQHTKPNRQEALDYYRRAAMHWNLSLSLYTKVETIENAEEGYYVVNTSAGHFKAISIIIATGFYDIPNYIGIEGENLDKVNHYYKEPHPYFGQKVAIIGASNSAVDAALETYRKGAEVTMIIKDDRISHHVKYWVKPDIENRISEGSIKVYFNSRVSQIRSKEIEVNTPDGIKTIANDFVLAMTGYKPDFSFLKKMGIDLKENESLTPVFNPETMETNRAHVYLAGVICGGLATHSWFIENSRVHAKIILEDIIKKREKL